MDIQEVNGLVKRGRGRPPKLQLVPPRFRLELVPCAGPEAYKLGNVWDFVKAGCEQVVAKSHGYYTWRAEDVYLTLRLNKATLYLAHLDGELKGFGIAQTNQDVFGNQSPYLLSWIGWCASRETRLCYFKELEIVAKTYKLKEIRHCSTRKGWLVDPPGPQWMTLTSSGWMKHPLPKETIRGLSAAPEITQKVMVE